MLLTAWSARPRSPRTRGRPPLPKESSSCAPPGSTPTQPACCQVSCRRKMYAANWSGFSARSDAGVRTGVATSPEEVCRFGRCVTYLSLRAVQPDELLANGAGVHHPEVGLERDKTSLRSGRARRTDRRPRLLYCCDLQRAAGPRVRDGGRRLRMPVQSMSAVSPHNERKHAVIRVLPHYWVHWPDILQHSRGKRNGYTHLFSRLRRECEKRRLSPFPTARRAPCVPCATLVF